MTHRFTMNVDLPPTKVDEFIESLRAIGGIEYITVTIDAENKRDAVRDVQEALEEYGATYRGTWYIGLKEAIQQVLRRQTARDVTAIGKVLKLRRA